MEWLVFSFLLIIVLLIGFSVVIFVLIRQIKQLSSNQRWEELIELGYAQATSKVTEQSKQVLMGEREVIKNDLDNKHRELSKLIGDLERVVADRQKELTASEKERAEQFGSLVKQIGEQQRVTDQLRVQTEQLATVLSNNPARGSWGERIIEDLLTSTGLQKGVHYVVQAKIAGTQQRPDVTLLLPDKRIVPVDVKFPFAALQQWAASEDKEAKKQYHKQFATDIKKHIDTVAGYILPGEGTLDYAVMFVPNEAVFSFLNQKLPDVLDYALSKRVLVTSPFTFLIVARTIMESYRNFLLGDQLRTVLTQIDGFITEWAKYRGALDKTTRAVEGLYSSWHELTGTRARQLDKRIEAVTTIGQKALDMPEKAPHAN